MNIEICDTKRKLGETAALQAAEEIKKNIQEKDNAHIILATGASQFETLKTLCDVPDIDWSKVVMFHLDEYVGLPASHKASFRRYLQERFVNTVPDIKEVHFINADVADPNEECKRLSKIISNHPIDVALVGIGENGHLAFNDPPADFNTETPYIIVELDEACRMQQVGEGWFKNIDEVPQSAITMSIKKIIESDVIICSVPGEKKSDAVKNCMEGEISNMHPASILQNHPRCTVYLDPDSSSRLTQTHS
ncbi:MAG: glucosamine-6-phosphate deaminase [Balneolales bacterium]